MSKDTKDIALKLIRLDGGTQPRVKIDQDAVADHKAGYELGEDRPPLDVFWDGADYWLADGFHRWHGASQAKHEDHPCIVHQGTQRDAILFSVGANGKHGLRRTNEDKRKAVSTLLNDKEWGEWSAREIATRCGVSHTFVNEIRPTMETASIVSSVKFKTPSGKTSSRKLKASPSKSSQEPTPEEDGPDREPSAKPKIKESPATKKAATLLAKVTGDFQKAADNLAPLVREFDAIKSSDSSFQKKHQELLGHHSRLFQICEDGKPILKTINNVGRSNGLAASNLRCAGIDSPDRRRR